MFDNRRVGLFSWKLQTVVALSKRSNVAGPRFSPALLKARASSVLHHVQHSSAWRGGLSKEPVVTSRYIYPCPRFCQVPTSRGLTSTNWSVSGDCFKQRIQQKRGKNVESCLSPTSVANILLSKMEHTTTNTDNPSTLKSHKRKHSLDDLKNSAKGIKADETLEVTDAAQSQDEVKSEDGTSVTLNEARSLVPARNHTTHTREQMLCHRPWEITKKGKQIYSSYGDLSDIVYEFSIASYNVLAQNLLVENNYLYRNCNSKYLNWDFRKKLLLSELKKYNSDILCLQEVNEDHYKDFFEPELRAIGYSGAYKKRTGKRKDGCATFYKSDKFDCLLTHPVEYLMPEVPLLDRDNVALVLLLQPKHYSRSIETAVCIANTHLLFNPRRGDIKLAQLMILFSVIDKLVYRESTSSELVYHPVVLSGDFNMEPFSNLYNFVRGGSLSCDGTVIRNLSGQELESSRGSNKCLEPEFLAKAAGITDNCQYLDIVQERLEKDLEATCVPPAELKAGFSSETINDLPPNCPDVLSQGSGIITHRLGLRSVYEHIRSSKPGKEEQEVTTYHSNACCTVDYIFYSSAGKREKKKSATGVNHSGGSHLELMSCLRLLSSEEMEQVGELPNELNASDHTILMAKFSFKL